MLVSEVFGMLDVRWEDFKGGRLERTADHEVLEANVKRSVRMRSKHDPRLASNVLCATVFVSNSITDLFSSSSISRQLSLSSSQLPLSFEHT